MIYKKSNKLLKVNNIAVNNEWSVISTENYINEIYPSKNLILKNDEEIRSLEITHNNELIVNQNKMIFRDKVISFQKGAEFVSNINSNIFFLVKKIDFDQAKVNFSLYNKNSSLSINLSIDNINPKFIYNNLIISFFKNEIVVFDFKLQKQIWSKTLIDLLITQSTKSYGDPILIDNKLCFYLYDSSRSTNLMSFLIINIEDGAVIFQSKEFGGWLTKFNSDIYSVYDRQINVLNPESFKIDKIDLSDSLSQLDKILSIDGHTKLYTKTFYLSNNLYIIEQNYLYFVEDKGSTIGIINLSTKNLEWSTNLALENKENLHIKDYKISVNKIYVLDQENNLHIFIKEETAKIS